MWAVLIFFANIFAQKTLKTENHLQSVSLSAWKKSTISADKSGAIFKPVLYALTYSNLRNLLLADQSVISYDEVNREQEAPDNKNKKDQHKDCKVRQELYRANQYEKPRQDAGVFYYHLKTD